MPCHVEEGGAAVLVVEGRAIMSGGVTHAMSGREGGAIIMGWCSYVGVVINATSGGDN